MSPIIINSVTLDEISSLQSIGKETFFETFAEKNTPENMTRYLTDSFSINQLTSELTDPHSEYYFARLDREIVGYLKLNFGGAQTDLQDPNAVEIERIYVRKAFLGKAVGQSLYEQALQVARQRHAKYVWLGVWEENPRAIRFYEKNGFIPFGTHVFHLGDDAQTDILMKKQMENS